MMRPACPRRTPALGTSAAASSASSGTILPLWEAPIFTALMGIVFTATIACPGIYPTRTYLESQCYSFAAVGMPVSGRAGCVRYDKDKVGLGDSPREAGGWMRAWPWRGTPRLTPGPQHLPAVGRGVHVGYVWGTACWSVGRTITQPHGGLSGRLNQLTEVKCSEQPGPAVSAWGMCLVKSGRYRQRYAHQVLEWLRYMFVHVKPVRSARLAGDFNEIICSL